MACVVLARPILRFVPPSLAVISLILLAGAKGVKLFVLEEAATKPPLIERIVVPMDYLVPESRVVQLDGFPIHTVEKFCWYEPFPCTPVLHPDLELRGDGLEEGFRIRRNE